jgi:hypothetical protein
VRAGAAVTTARQAGDGDVRRRNVRESEDALDECADLTEATRLVFKAAIDRFRGI